MKSRSLKKKAIKKITLHDFDITLFRETNGIVNAVQDTCPHMGASLARGKVVDNCIQCPYHHWQYNGKGEVTHIPRLKENESFPNVQLKTFVIKEKYGFIWLYIGESQATDPLPYHPAWNNQAIYCCHLGRIKIPFHHHLIIANDYDIQHLTAVHGYKPSIAAFKEQLSLFSDHPKQFGSRYDKGVLNSADLFSGDSKYMKAILKLSRFPNIQAVESLTWYGNTVILHYEFSSFMGVKNWFFDFVISTNAIDNINQVHFFLVSSYCKPSLLLCNAHKLLALPFQRYFTRQDIRAMKDIINERSHYIAIDRRFCDFVKYVNSLPIVEH